MNFSSIVERVSGFPPGPFISMTTFSIRNTISSNRPEPLDLQRYYRIFGQISDSIFVFRRSWARETIFHLRHVLFAKRPDIFFFQLWIVQGRPLLPPDNPPRNLGSLATPVQYVRFFLASAGLAGSLGGLIFTTALVLPSA